VFVWGFLSLRSARHIPLFALVAAPVAAQAAEAAWLRAAARFGKNSAVAALRDFAQDFGGRPRPVVWPAAATVLAVMTCLPAATFPDTRFPVAAVERNLARLAPANAPPRVLTSDQWADYLIYRLYPRQRVFFDGRSDFFGPRLGGDYRKLLTAGPGWRELVDRYRFAVALLPRDWPLAATLDREPGWRQVYGDRLSVLYVRQGGGT
jgi:hypothetical protein